MLSYICDCVHECNKIWLAKMFDQEKVMTNLLTCTECDSTQIFFHFLQLLCIGIQLLFILIFICWFKIQPREARVKIIRRYLLRELCMRDLSQEGHSELSTTEPTTKTPDSSFSEYPLPLGFDAMSTLYRTVGGAFLCVPKHHDTNTLFTQWQCTDREGTQEDDNTNKWWRSEHFRNWCGN